jgi:hypothetical protein
MTAAASYSRSATFSVEDPNKKRGQEIACRGLLDVEYFARAAHLNFAFICENEYPLGSLPDLVV